MELLEACAAAAPAHPMLPKVPSTKPLSGRQKRHLRSLAQRLEAVAWVGGEGLAPGIVRAIDEALGTHELVKVRMRDPQDKHGLAQALADATARRWRASWAIPRSSIARIPRRRRSHCRRPAPHQRKSELPGLLLLLTAVVDSIVMRWSSHDGGTRS
jgi:RNA-binding protein YhbY